MKKQWKQFVFVLLTVFLLTACGIQSVEQYEKMEAEELSVEEAVSEPREESPAIKDEPAVEKVEEAKPVEKVVPKEEPQEEPQPPKFEQKVEVKEEPKPEPKLEIKPEPVPTPEPIVEAKSEPKQEKVEVKKDVAPAPKEVPTPEPAEQKRTVTIAIYVHSLVAHMDKLHPSLKSEKYVPASGVVLNPVTYELLSEKDTVWDVLRRAAKEHNIQLEYEGADENIYDSVYIEGIHHLYEFSAGPLSGWMYKVNGVFPNYGASQYTLEDGDVIEWHYTVDLGRDLGKDV
ncbi:MAG: DUF4430 domain-containing protein [Solibacillus sp.]